MAKILRFFFELGHKCESFILYVENHSKNMDKKKKKPQNSTESLNITIFYIIISSNL